MQSQAAPQRFSLSHPIITSIPKISIPKTILNALTKNRISRNPIKYQMNMIDPITQQPYTFEDDGENLIGRFPQLLMRIYDQEIIHLATDYYNSADFHKRNKEFTATFEKFDDINCRDITCTCKAQEHPDFECLFGQHFPEDAILYRSCKRTIFAAGKRQMKAAPTPDRVTAEKFLKFAVGKIKHYLGNELQMFGYSYNQWYNHLPRNKQIELEIIHKFFHPELYTVEDVVKYKGRLPVYTGLDSIPKEWWEYEGICKKEMQGRDGKPRMVCSIPPFIKYVMGPICWKLEEVVADNFPSYCGGMNLGQMTNKINHYIDEGFDLVAEGDGSAFDNTQDVVLKEVDRYIYKQVLNKVHHVPKEVFAAVSTQYYKIMNIVNINPITRRKQTLFQYAILGTVFSGDCDTTLMNTLRMGLYVWYWNESENLQYGIDFICFSKGDDFTIMYNPKMGKYFNRLSYLKYFLSKNKPKDPNAADNRSYGLGQIMKFVEYGDQSIIKFCSLRAWYSNYLTGHIYLTRDPMKFEGLSRYSRKTRSMCPAKKGVYLQDQAIALKQSYQGLYYFDAMIKIYEEEANTLMTDNLKFKLKQRDKRVTIPLETLDGCGTYDPRKQGYQIMDTEYGNSYWTTIKWLYSKNDIILDDIERETINQQIQQEFSELSLSVRLLQV